MDLALVMDGLNGAFVVSTVGANSTDGVLCGPVFCLLSFIVRQLLYIKINKYKFSLNLLIS